MTTPPLSTYGTSADAASSSAYTTPERILAATADLTPPGAPKARSRLSRGEQLQHALERTVLLWKIVPEEVAKSVRAAGVRVKRKPAKEGAAFTNPLTRTKTGKVKTAGQCRCHHILLRPLPR